MREAMVSFTFLFTFPGRLMVGHLTLTQLTLVRIQLGDPVHCPMVQLAAHLTLIQEVPRSNRGGASI